MVLADSDPRRLSCLRPGRHRHRALRDPLSLRPPPGDPARHFRRQPDPAAGGAADLLAAEPQRGHPGLDERRPANQPGVLAHLQPSLHHLLRPGGVRHPAHGAQENPPRPAGAGREPEPGHRPGHGHPQRTGQRAHLRARLRHRRYRRRGPGPAHQRGPQPGPDLHHRLLHGGGVRRRRKPVGHAHRRLRPGHRQQVHRTAGRRRARQDHGAGVHHPVHSAQAARAVPQRGRAAEDS